jgi:glycosyltransferase involved in cell wall biosynthesis
MKILLVHNSYQLPGGEDVVYARERDLLLAHHHQVYEYQRSNNEISEYSKLQKLKLSVDVIWNSDSKNDFAERIDEIKPDIVHVHNTFMMISPSIYSACRERNIPVVQTLHNYRLLCPGATFFRDGKPCHDCESTLAHSVLHGCYRDSRTATASVAAMVAWHRAAGTYSRLIDKYIALTEFSRSNFLRAGFDPAKMVVKPNFVDPDPGERSGVGAYALYVGRLSSEKGLRTVIEAWQKLKQPIPLRIAGTGPMVEELNTAIAMIGTHIEYLGQIPSSAVMATMRDARFLVFPSELYENFPLTLCEAFACGVPVIASNRGAMKEIVADGVTGTLFEAGNSDDLAAKVEHAWDSAEEMCAIGRRARQEFERKYTAERNYQRLMDVYESVIPQRKLLTTGRSISGVDVQTVLA